MLPAFTQVGSGADTEVSADATEAMEAGMIYAWGAGFVYIDGNQNFAIGDRFNGKDQLTLQNRREDSAFTSAAIAVDDDIFVETATGLPKTAAGAGIIGPVGQAVAAKAAGQPNVQFRLNKTANNLT